VAHPSGLGDSWRPTRPEKQSSPASTQPAT
jgi:hypothetical protein